MDLLMELSWVLVNLIVKRCTNCAIQFESKLIIGYGSDIFFIDEINFIASRNSLC